MTGVAEAVMAGRMSGRLWLYANYHCNLACTYCLTESAPDVAPRLLDAEHMRRLVEEGRRLGFTGVGITGGEPFLVRELPELLADLARVLPVVVLTNATLFTSKVVERMRPLADLPVTVQVSLDRPEAVANDEMRGPRNFQRVLDGLPRLIDAGIHVRIATTLPFDEIGPTPSPEQQRLCALHRSLGIGDADHVTRPIIRRGRAVTGGLGVQATLDDLEPELTITTDGAFWSPFAPTVVGGRLDTDLLLTRTTAPLDKPVTTMLGIVEGRPPGHDATLGIK